MTKPAILEGRVYICRGLVDTMFLVTEVHSDGLSVLWARRRDGNLLSSKIDRLKFNDTGWQDTLVEVCRNYTKGKGK